MKKLLLNIFLFSFFQNCFSQEGYFYHKKGEGDKYFVSLGYGEGIAYWNSVFKSTEFYDKDGSVINRGDFEFIANSPTKHYDVNVLAPIKKIRLGLGICFEHHYLSQLKFYSKSGEEYLLFDEGLRFDKIYLNAEIPFKYISNKKYSFSWNVHCGWFSYTNVKRFNFIGEKPFPIAILGCAGMTADYEIYPAIYVFAFPNIEYKYYNNARSEAPVDIVHRVFSASVIGGIRVDMGKFNY
jgi:hypothetical protein